MPQRAPHFTFTNKLLALGGIIVALWPWSSFFTLGIFLGVDLIFTGSGWISVALALKRRPAV